MDDVKELIEQIFRHFSVERKELKHYQVRKRFIDIFTPVIVSLNEKYSHVVEQKHVESFGFRHVGSIVFENYKNEFFDDKKNCIKFDFKTMEMTISNANDEEFYIIRNAKIPNLMVFHSVMNALGFHCL